MVWRCAYCLDITLRFILSLFHKINLVIFQTLLHSKWLDSRYLVCTTPTIIVSWLFLKCQVVCLKMCICCFILIYNPQLNVYHFSSIFRLQCYQYLINVYTVLYIFYASSVYAYVMAWRYWYALGKILTFFFFILFLTNLSCFIIAHIFKD